VVVRRSALAGIIRQQSSDGQQIQLPPWRVTAQQLGQLIDAMLDTLSSSDVIGPLADWPESMPSPFPNCGSCTW
jgi:hypothetical protein